MLGEGGDGAEHLAHEAHEGDQPADGEVALEDQPAAQAEHDQAEERHDHVHREPEQPAEELQPDLGVEQPVRGPAEAGPLPGLEGERLHHRLGPVVLRRHAVDAADLLLDAMLRLSAPADIVRNTIATSGAPARTTAASSGLRMISTTADTTSDRTWKKPSRSVCDRPCSSWATSEKSRESTSPAWRR